MQNDIKEILISEDRIENRLQEMGEKITADYKDKDNFLLVGVLKGAVIFMSDLIRHIKLPWISWPYPATGHPRNLPA